MSRLDYCQYELVDDCYDWKNDHCDGCNIFKAYCEGERRAKNLIVKCKDCKNGKYELVDNKEWIYCKHHFDYWLADDFCSYGERKVGEE